MESAALKKSSTQIIVEQVIAAYCIGLIVFGTLMNALSCVVCLRRELRKVPTFIFLASMALADTIPLYIVNLNLILETFYGYSIQNVSYSSCKTFLYVQVCSMDVSAWILVAMTIERCLSVRFKTWRLSMFNSTKAVVVVVAIIAVLSMYNIVFIIGVEYVNMTDSANNQSSARCVNLDEYHFANQMHTYAYSIIPFVVLVTANAILVYLVKKNKDKTGQSTQSDRFKRQIVISVFSVTLGFILFTLPNSIVIGYFLMTLIRTENGWILIKITLTLAHTYHCSSFIVLKSFNKQFSAEFAKMVRVFRVKNTVHTATTTTAAKL